MRSPSSLRRAALALFAALLLSAGLSQAAGSPKDDRRIEAAAAGTYNFKTVLKDDKITVKANSGVVTLTGTTATEHHKWLAEETLLGLSGTKRVENKLAVADDQPAASSDAWFSLKVKSALLFHRNVNALTTEVKTLKGVVTLTGPADSEAQRELTTEYAKDVDGVTDVINGMVVTTAMPRSETVGEKIDDASITAQIKTTLLFHKSTHAVATKVTTRDGVVTLKGHVGSGAERDLVGKLAEDISGVTKVVNDLVVTKAQGKT
jgi:osmotically-inducible protein OsmY